MFNNIKTVASEVYTNRYRLMRLANYELMGQYRGTMFGFLWNFLNPALQIFVYWFVFAIGLNSSPPRDGFPYIIWMIVGIIPWFYISGVLMTSTMSIHNYGGILKHMYIPLSIVPIKTVFSGVIGHVWAMCMVFLIIFLSGYSVSGYVFQTLYFLFCSIVFLVGYSLFTSAITVVFKDFSKFMNSVIRLLFYITPVVWVQERLPENLIFVLKLNPFAYIIDGYRDSILYGRNLMWHWKQGCFFWAVTIILLIVGCNVHVKFRKQFIDLI
ncbi:MAG: ABC transporter permease [Firmicutes bacterium]|nr:ABC transporter permease [Bacillota bacterium]